MATEAGHIQLAARLGREQQILAQIADENQHTPYDSLLSGPGLLRIYQACCRLEGVLPQLASPPAVTAAALAGDPLAHEALHRFCAWLGSYAGDLAMLYGASGGIYIAGGFLAAISDTLLASDFVMRFLDKGVMRPFLQEVPVYLVDHAHWAVIGAASQLLEQAE